MNYSEAVREHLMIKRDVRGLKKQMFWCAASHMMNRNRPCTGRFHQRLMFGGSSMTEGERHAGDCVLDEYKQYFKCCNDIVRKV